MSHQLQLAIARADSESLARSIAEETIADLEKERTMKEIEMKELVSRHRADHSAKETLILNVSLFVLSTHYCALSFFEPHFYCHYSQVREVLHSVNFEVVDIPPDRHV